MLLLGKHLLHLREMKLRHILLLLRVSHAHLPWKGRWDRGLGGSIIRHHARNQDALRFSRRLHVGDSVGLRMPGHVDWRLRRSRLIMAANPLHLLLSPLISRFGGKTRKSSHSKKEGIATALRTFKQR